eukprot:scaffold6261_cov28-Tisochrysis_lutea.AAC.5
MRVWLKPVPPSTYGLRHGFVLAHGRSLERLLFRLLRDAQQNIGAEELTVCEREAVQLFVLGRSHVVARIGMELDEFLEHGLHLRLDNGPRGRHERARAAQEGHRHGRRLSSCRRITTGGGGRVALERASRYSRRCAVGPADSPWALRPPVGRSSQTTWARPAAAGRRIGRKLRVWRVDIGAQPATLCASRARLRHRRHKAATRGNAAPRRGRKAQARVRQAAQQKGGEERRERRGGSARYRLVAMSRLDALERPAGSALAARRPFGLAPHKEGQPVPGVACKGTITAALEPLGCVGHEPRDRVRRLSMTGRVRQRLLKPGSLHQLREAEFKVRLCH